MRRSEMAKICRQSKSIAAVKREHCASSSFSAAETWRWAEAIQRWEVDGHTLCDTGQDRIRADFQKYVCARLKGFISRILEADGYLKMLSPKTLPVEIVT
ncbi:MAG: hypothetical protein AAYR33_02115 [Acetobacteraceae bacterium]